MVPTVSDFTAAFFAMLCQQLTVAARGKRQVLQGICNEIFSFFSFHRLKCLFILLQPWDK